MDVLFVYVTYFLFFLLDELFKWTIATVANLVISRVLDGLLAIHRVLY